MAKETHATNFCDFNLQSLLVAVRTTDSIGDPLQISLAPRNEFGEDLIPNIK